MATYLLSGSGSLEDKKGFLPALTWIPSVPDTQEDGAFNLDGKSWLASREDVSNLIQALQRANSFSIRVICTPAEIEGADGRIISISNHEGLANLSLWQREGNLVFWFRNSLSVRRDQLPLNIPEVFTEKRARDILVAYDGSNLVVYIDGKRDPRRYEVTPGVPIAQVIRHIKVNELEGYTYIYYALVFRSWRCVARPDYKANKMASLRSAIFGDCTRFAVYHFGNDIGQGERARLFLWQCFCVGFVYDSRLFLDQC